MKQKITNIKEFIEYTKLYNNLNKHFGLQVNSKDTKYDRELTEYLVSIADTVICQELTGMSRGQTNLKVEEIIEKITPQNSLLSGIKIVHIPYIKINEWEKWEDGFIEGFVRTCKKGEPDYFIWTYIRMEYLESIIKKFKNKLIYHNI
jgi:hypothetical protein